MTSLLPQSGRPLWHSADRSFVGWVPTILGHLSFSMVGIKHKWSQHRSYNCLNPLTGERVIATLQERTAQDFPIWNWLLKLIRPSTTQDYLLVGRTYQADIPILEEKVARLLKDTQGALAGSVYVIPYQEKIEANWEREDLVNKIHVNLNPKIGSPSSLESDLDTKISDYIAKELIVHKFNFCLYRSGEVRIWSTDAEALGYRPTSSEYTSDELVILERLPRQVYYFIKDAAHSHYHHEPNSDQVLPLVRSKKVSLKSGEPNHIDNELAWRREVLWGLARVLARYRREGDLKQLKRARGILAYADAFQATVGRVRRGINLEDEPVFDNNITSYDFDHAKQSVEALDSLRTWSNSGNFQIIAGAIAIVFSASSFWATSVRLLSARCPANDSTAPAYCADLISDRALNISVWVANHPLIFAVYLVIPTIIMYSIFVKDIQDFRWAKKPAHFISAVSRAIGATLTARFNNAYVGFSTSIIVLLSFLGLLVYLLYLISTAMHAN